MTGVQTCALPISSDADAKVIIVPTEEKKEAMESGKDYFVTLASASEVEIVADETNIPEDAVSVVIDGVKIFIPLDELVDFAKEGADREVSGNRGINQIQKILSQTALCQHAAEGEHRPSIRHGAGTAADG